MAFQFSFQMANLNFQINFLKIRWWAEEANIIGLIITVLESVREKIIFQSNLQEIFPVLNRNNLLTKRKFEVLFSNSTVTWNLFVLLGADFACPWRFAFGYQGRQYNIWHGHQAFDAKFLKVHINSTFKKVKTNFNSILILFNLN